MKIYDIKHNINLIKYDDVTFLIKGRTFIEIDFLDDVVRSKIRFDIDDDIILDGFSIPKLARCWFKTNYKDINENLAFIVHDILFAFGSFSKTPLSFKQSNLMLLALMERAKKPKRAYKRKLMYKAVSSVFGRKCFDTRNKYDENNVKCIKWRWV